MFRWISNRVANVGRTLAVVAAATMVTTGCGGNSDTATTAHCDTTQSIRSVELTSGDATTEAELITYRDPNCDVETDGTDVDDAAKTPTIAAGTITVTAPEGFSVQMGTSTGTDLKPPADIEFQNGTSIDVAAGNRVYVSIESSNNRYGLYTAIAN